MFDKDIDIHVYTKELNASETLKALAPVISHPRTKRCTFINGADTDEFCLEWHLRMTSEDGELWTVDMIQILAGSPFDGFFEGTADAIIQALTPETKLAILQLKKAAPAGNKICGIEFYKAVIQDNIRTWEEFVEWRKSNPIETMLTWRPGTK